MATDSIDASDAGFQARLDLIPVRGRFVASWRVDDGLMVKKRIVRSAVRLNETGRLIWSLCDGYRTVRSIIEALEHSFVDQTSQPIVEDVLTTLAGLESKGLLSLKMRPRSSRGMRKIDLRTIPFYVINCEADSFKRERMQRQLTDLGLRFEFVSAIECDPPSLGTTLSHLKVLSLPHIKTPFGVLEDDCVFNENFRYEYTVPRKLDAFYLGISRFGTEVPGKLSYGMWDQVRWSRYDRNTLRVFNMLALHAVLYMNDRYRQVAQKAVIDGLTNREYIYPGDVGVATTHLSNLVLTPNETICYQAKELGGHEESTTGPLTVIKR